MYLSLNNHLMKRTTLYILSLLLACGNAAAEQVAVTTGTTELLIEVTPGDTPRFLYYGSPLSEADRASLKSVASPLELYPVYGLDPMHEKAMAVRHADGNMSLKLVADGYEKEKFDGGSVLTVHTRDEIYPFAVDLKYRVYDDSDVIEMWAEATNKGKKPVVLEKYASAYLPVRRGDVWLSHIYGAWGNNGRLMQEALKPGMKRIKNKDGARNSETAHSEVMFSLDGKPAEDHGATIGAALCYSGNYALDIDTDESDYHHFFAGINGDNSAYTLQRNETFVTPPLAVSFSKEGVGGVSRNFHRWVRRHNINRGDRERKILLNSWEGCFFNLNEPDMARMMGEIADLGGELFVMDDGWFGEKYPRNTDSSSLGDWVVDLKKFPDGLKSLTDDAAAAGVGFGIWLEPEMVNTISELYEKHPDWVVAAPGRKLMPSRGGTQLVLDLSNPAVQDFIVDVFDRVMTQAPEIEYIKWDANSAIRSHGSTYLSADKQSHLYIEWHRGLQNILERLRAKYPDLTIQLCSSGGARVNMGLLKYFDEFWTSDNTDGRQRVFLQWGTSYFYPSMAQASHICAVPSQQTHRTVPLKYRTDVAMSGRLGIELQPKHMSEPEKDFVRAAIADYKKIRPLVMFGDLYRLTSPYDDLGSASLMYVAEDKNQAVCYWYKLDGDCGAHVPVLKMAGLDPEAVYAVEELTRIDDGLAANGKSFSGRFLMEHGLDMPLYNYSANYYQGAANGGVSDYASRVLWLKKVSDQ